ncbi:MAG: glycosyltransferase [Phycisphaerales bacterium]|nr:glycosyltransferase [Phycisphaerales bacterium]
MTPPSRADADAAPTSILFAGGGSGGHIAPGLAIIEAIRDLDPAATCRAVCSDRPVDAHMLSRAGVPFLPVAALPLSVRPDRFVRFAIRFRRARRVIAAEIRRHGVTRVVALGGFVAAPAAAAARSVRCPITLVNLDAVPGRANRWIAHRASTVLSAVPTPATPDFASMITGMPVRRAAIASDPPEACRASFGLDPDRPTLLVTGASQGAESINRMMTALLSGHGGLFSDWQVLHLSGAGHDAELRAAYAEAGVRARVEPFVDAMGRAWGAASLAISRAGANSVAEAIANAVPTVFMPYPYHADQHQRLNAWPYVERDLALLMDDEIDATRNAAAMAGMLGPLLAPDAATDAPGPLAAIRSRLVARPTEPAAAIIARSLLG